MKFNFQPAGPGDPAALAVLKKQQNSRRQFLSGAARRSAGTEGIARHRTLALSRQRRAITPCPIP